jgi:hypothetical protein
MPSEYHEYVKAHLRSCRGSPTEKMKECAAKWRAHKAKNGGAAYKSAAEMKGAGVKHFAGGATQWYEPNTALAYNTAKPMAASSKGAGRGGKAPRKRHTVAKAGAGMPVKHGGSVFNITTDQVVPFPIARKPRVGRHAWITSEEMKAMAALSR